MRLALLLAVVPRFAGGRILGFHLDDERCTGPDSRFGNTSTLVPPCLAVLQEYLPPSLCLSATPHTVCLSVCLSVCFSLPLPHTDESSLSRYADFVGNLSGTGLTLAVDSGACVAPTCYNITWNGVSKHAHEHVRCHSKSLSLSLSLSLSTLLPLSRREPHSGLSPWLRASSLRRAHRSLTLSMRQW